jgi:hypothetical protein
MSTLISLDIELNSISSFLKMVLDAVDIEYKRIKAISESFGYEHYDNESNALYTPMTWENMAIKFVLGELNAIVEWELNNLVNKEYFKNEKALKSNRTKTVYDLKINEVIKTIENIYQIKINKVASYPEIMDIRKKVNSFKHRKGYKDPWKNGSISIPDKFKFDREEAYQRINDVRNFLKDLWKKTKNKKHNKGFNSDKAFRLAG